MGSNMDESPHIDALDIEQSVRELVSLLKSPRFVQTMTDMIAPHMEAGSPGWDALNTSGQFKLDQDAAEILHFLDPPAAVQAAIVKSTIHTPDTNYHLQLFPVHNDLESYFPQTVAAIFPLESLPAWLGPSVQVTRSHGVKIPIVHTDSGWTLRGACEADGAELLMEWVVRPTELDLTFLGLPSQAKIDLELGMQVTWKIKSPDVGSELPACIAGSIIGIGAGLATAYATGYNPLLLTSGGAAVGDLTAQVLHQRSAEPTAALTTWADATLNATDLDAATPSDGLTEFPRNWQHAHDDRWHPDDLKQQAKAAIAPIVERYRKGPIVERTGDHNASPAETAGAGVRKRSVAPAQRLPLDDRASGQP